MKHFYLTIGGKRHAVSVARAGGPNELAVTVDGQTHRVTVDPAAPGEAADRPAVDPGAPGQGAAGEIRAPLPGVVLSVAARPGETARAGETLLVLEAMKMENPILADSDCAVEAVHVTKGDKVEAAQLLMEVTAR